MSRHPDAARAALRSTLLAAALGALGMPHAALPRDQVPAAEVPPAAEDVPAITVTGARPGSTGVARSPATVATQEHPTIQDSREMARQVFGPEKTAASSSPISATYASLRNEGLQRMLARDDRHGDLPRNSRGVAPASASISERVHSLTAPASSAYGPEAVSGVLDFIVNKHACGIRITGSYGFYSQDSAAPIHASRKHPAAVTFADHVTSTLQLLAATAAQRPAT
jgi:hypothetical protein